MTIVVNFYRVFYNVWFWNCAFVAVSSPTEMYLSWQKTLYTLKRTTIYRVFSKCIHTETGALFLVFRLLSRYSLFNFSSVSEFIGQLILWPISWEERVREVVRLYAQLTHEWKISCLVAQWEMQQSARQSWHRRKLHSPKHSQLWQFTI